MLIQIWQSYPSYSAASKLSTWIYRVALNTAISFVRKQKRSIDFHEIQEQLPASLTEPVIEKEQKIEMLYSCIHQLAKDDRAIILLYLEGNPYDEIAEIIGLKANHIGVKILRIKKKLHQSLIKKGYGKI